MTDEERVLSCQREIRRLRSVVREYEEEKKTVSCMVGNGKQNTVWKPGWIEEGETILGYISASKVEKIIRFIVNVL